MVRYYEEQSVVAAVDVPWVTLPRNLTMVETADEWKEEEGLVETYSYSLPNTHHPIKLSPT